MGKMVKQTARGTVGRVNRAEETPGLGQELSNGSRLQLGKKATTVHHAEMTDEPEEVELLRHNCEA